MILRVFRARAKAGREKELESFLLSSAVPTIRQRKGCQSVYVGKPLELGLNEFILISTWQTKEDLIAFAGANWRKPVILPHEADVIEQGLVDHYEIVPTFGQG